MSIWHKNFFGHKKFSINWNALKLGYIRHVGLDGVLNKPCIQDYTCIRAYTCVYIRGIRLFNVAITRVQIRARFFLYYLTFVNI